MLPIEILIIFLLILLNGVLAMAEIAIVSSKKVYLQNKAMKGNKRAQVALKLVENPNRFLSTVQIGITLVGIFAGAFGGATIASKFSKFLNSIPVISPYSDFLGVVFVVLSITYLSLVIGELVPKRIALTSPEKISMIVARPMYYLSIATYPLVHLLSISTDFILKLLNIRKKKELVVTDDEIKMLLQEGARVGVFELAERDIVERTFQIGDKRVKDIMTQIAEVVWLDISDSNGQIIKRAVRNPFTYFPVRDKKTNQILGAVRTEDLFASFITKKTISLEENIQKPLYVPETLIALRVLELFRKANTHFAFVVNEKGRVRGIMSLADILEDLVGDIPARSIIEERNIMKRDKNSWFVDGTLDIEEFFKRFPIPQTKKQSAEYHTVGGFVMTVLGKVPTTGNTFEIENYKIEVVDMDGKRVDKIMITKKKN